MKKMIFLMLALVLCLGLCACESKEERAFRQAQEYARQTNEAYENAVKKADAFQRDMESYQSAINRLK